MPERQRDEERRRAYRSGYDEGSDFERGPRRFEGDRNFERTLRAPFSEYGRYGGHGPRSDYEYGGGGFQRFEEGRVGEFVGGEFERGAQRSAFGWREGSKRGLGPRNYARSDERIREDICDELTEDPVLDASEIEVKVAGGEVTLTGTVDDRLEKRRAEDDAEQIIGVRHVQNNLRVVEPTSARAREIGTTSGTAGGNVTGTVAGATAGEPAREREKT